MPKQSNIVVQQAALSSNPATPPVGYSVIFPKTDKNWYIMDSTGTVRQLGTTYIVNQVINSAAANYCQSIM